MFCVSPGAASVWASSSSGFDRGAPGNASALGSRGRKTLQGEERATVRSTGPTLLLSYDNILQLYWFVCISGLQDHKHVAVIIIYKTYPRVSSSCSNGGFKVSCCRFMSSLLQNVRSLICPPHWSLFVDTLHVTNIHRMQLCCVLVAVCLSCSRFVPWKLFRSHIIKIILYQYMSCFMSLVKTDWKSFCCRHILISTDTVI